MDDLEPPPDPGRGRGARLAPVTGMHRTHPPAKLPGQRNRGGAPLHVGLEQDPRPLGALRQGPGGATRGAKPLHPEILLAGTDPAPPAPSPANRRHRGRRSLIAPAHPATTPDAGRLSSI